MRAVLLLVYHKSKRASIAYRFSIHTKAAGSHEESLPPLYAHLLLIVETVVEDALGFLFTAGQRLHRQRFGEDGEADFGFEKFDHGGL